MTASVTLRLLAVVRRFPRVLGEQLVTGKISILSINPGYLHPTVSVVRQITYGITLAAAVCYLH